MTPQQDPSTIQQFIDNACLHDANDIQFQVGTCLIMLRDIELIYELDRELSDYFADHDEYRYEIYDSYMHRMGYVLNGLMRYESILKKMFPTFYHGNLRKLITIHNNRVNQ